MLPNREANSRRVVGVLFDGVRLDTPQIEDLSVGKLMATTAAKRTVVAQGPVHRRFKRLRISSAVEDSLRVRKSD
jgi:hypothetical protein